LPTKKIFYVLISFVLAHSINAQPNPSYIENELIIWLKPGVNAHEFAKGTFGDVKPKKLLSRRLNIWLFELTDGTGVQRNARLNTLKLSEDVKYVQNNHRIATRSVTPNDTKYEDQWAPAKIKLPEVWDEYTTGGISADGDEIVIAVIDNEFYLPHEDLDFWKNTNEIPGNGIDDDNNGYIDDYDGWNAYTSTGIMPTPSDVHGTHVAGVAGARGNNGIGISGVNWNVKTMPIAGSTLVESVAVEAYGYVLEMRALYNETNGEEGAFIVVANSSFGALPESDPEDYPIWCAMYDELGAEGILSCTAAPNEDQNVDVVNDVPTSCSSNFLITVTNTDSTDNLSSAVPTAYGASTVDIGAPGTEIWSTAMGPGGSSYVDLHGTSHASPQVAGVVALMYAAMPQCMIQEYKNNPADFALAVRQQLLQGADAVPSLSGWVAYGRLNALKAIENALGIGSSPPSISGPSLVCTDTVTFVLNNVPASAIVKWNVVPPELFTTSAGTGSTVHLQRSNPSGIGNENLIMFTNLCGDTLATKHFNVGIPDVPVLIHGEPGNPVKVGVGTAFQTSAPDNGMIDWAIVGNPAHYDYSLSPDNLTCSFTPTVADQTFRIKARTTYGCGYSAYDSVSVLSLVNKPDLVIQSLTLSIPEGSNITVSHYLKNQGVQPAVSPIVNYYRSTNSTYDGSDTYLGTSYVSTAAPDTSIYVTKNLTLSGSGDYIITYADPYNAISEISETNNTQARIMVDGLMAGDFSVYPVPFENELNINLMTTEENMELLEGKAFTREIYLIDFHTSKLVYKTTTSDKDHTIDTKTIPLGQYMLIVKGVKTESLLVVKK